MSRYKYDEIEIKTDCHNYHREHRKCNCLTETFCKKELCSFYLTEAEAEAKQKQIIKWIQKNR